MHLSEIDCIFQIQRACPDLSGICMFIEQRSKYYMRPWPGSNNNLRYSFYKHLMPLASDDILYA
jgi:hypothetical protein